ncbi:MAG: hypothetical protein GX950_02825 [Candidatus Diapherotrites archaeon]|jgi:hypothetical protein|uniref:Uncharacterized protein n=1 Tax=Candidatus Iainarchaeum sp. TaxID=3101447 RepID=A0A7K4BZL4_9ARCH|nr:hypothetical protein [Candidatus Diapherotrites archaeon]
MGDKEVQQGIFLIAISVFFLLSSIKVLEWDLFDPGFSSIAAFILVAIGVYLVSKK